MGKMMKGRALSILLILIIGFSGCSDNSKDFYQIGYEDGCQIGKKDGYDSGYKSASILWNEGYLADISEEKADISEDPSRPRYAEGYNIGYDEGYAAGYSEGYTIGDQEGEAAHNAKLKADAEQVNSEINAAIQESGAIEWPDNMGGFTIKYQKEMPGKTYIKKSDKYSLDIVEREGLFFIKDNLYSVILYIQINDEQLKEIMSNENFDYIIYSFIVADVENIDLALTQDVDEDSLNVDLYIDYGSTYNIFHGTCVDIIKLNEYAD